MMGKRKPICRLTIHDYSMPYNSRWIWRIQTPTLRAETPPNSFHRLPARAIKAVRREAKRFADDYQIVEGFDAS